MWNPCFDITPAALIEGIITEKGLLPKKDGAFDVPSFMQNQVRSSVHCMHACCMSVCHVSGMFVEKGWCTSTSDHYTCSQALLLWFLQRHKAVSGIYCNCRNLLFWTDLEKRLAKEEALIVLSSARGLTIFD